MGGCLGPGAYPCGGGAAASTFMGPGPDAVQATTQIQSTAEAIQWTTGSSLSDSMWLPANEDVTNKVITDPAVLSRARQLSSLKSWSHAPEVATGAGRRPGPVLRSVRMREDPPEPLQPDPAAAWTAGSPLQPTDPLSTAAQCNAPKFAQDLPSLRDS